MLMNDLTIQTPPILYPGESGDVRRSLISLSFSFLRRTDGKMQGTEQAKQHESGRRRGSF